MKWKVERHMVTTKVWGPEDTYEVAGDEQVFGFRSGDIAYRVVSDFTDDPTDLYEFVDHMNEAQE